DTQLAPAQRFALQRRAERRCIEAAAQAQFAAQFAAEIRLQILQAQRRQAQGQVQRLAAVTLQAQLAFADLQAQLAGRGVGSEMGFAVAANGVAEQFTAQLVEIEVDAPVVVGLTQIEGQLAVEATAQLRLQSRGIEVSQRQLELQV